MKNIQYKSLIKIAVVAVIGCLTVIYFNTIIDLIGLFLNVSFPLILGAIMAFILDIPLRRLESIYFPKSQNKWIKRTRPSRLYRAGFCRLGIDYSVNHLDCHSGDDLLFPIHRRSFSPSL